MPIWFWLNIPAMVLVFSAVVGIPTWLVLRWPDQKREHSRPAPAGQLMSAAKLQPSTPSSRPGRELQPTH
jgi:hypothetical protein